MIDQCKYELLGFSEHTSLIWHHIQQDRGQIYML